MTYANTTPAWVIDKVESWRRDQLWRTRDHPVLCSGQRRY